MGIEDRLRALTGLLLDERRLEDHMAALRRIEEGEMARTGINATRTFVGLDASGTVVASFGAGRSWGEPGRPEDGVEAIYWLYAFADEAGPVVAAVNAAGLPCFGAARSKPDGIDFLAMLSDPHRQERIDRSAAGRIGEDDGDCDYFTGARCLSNRLAYARRSGDMTPRCIVEVQEVPAYRRVT